MYVTRVRGRSGSLLKTSRWRGPSEEAARSEQTPEPVSAPGRPKQLQPRLKAGINSAPDFVLLRRASSGAARTVVMVASEGTPCQEAGMKNVECEMMNAE